MIPFPEGKFGVILLDPAWKYDCWRRADTKRYGGANAQYPCMTVDEICALPVGDLAAKDCALFLWITWPILVEGVHLRLMDAWKFRPSTCAFLWNKTYRHGNPYLGLGHHTRSGSEPCLLGLRGHPKRKSTSVRQVITAPVGRHSAKPIETYARIEALFDGPRIELFARTRRSGWQAWGLEVPDEIQAEASFG